MYVCINILFESSSKLSSVNYRIKSRALFLVLNLVVKVLNLQQRKHIIEELCCQNNL